MPLLTVICGALSFPIGIFYSFEMLIATWVFVSEINLAQNNFACNYVLCDT